MPVAQEDRVGRQTLNRPSADKSTKHRSSPLTLLLVGFFLLGVGALKLYGLHANPLPRIGWFAQSQIQILVSQWELFLGLWLLTGWGRRRAWIAALSTFFLFAGVSLYLGWNGTANCGCFGSIKTSPWTAFAVDVGMVGALAFAGRPRSALGSAPDEIRFSALLAPSPSILLIAALMLASVAGWAIFKYGSLHLAFARLNNEIVTVDEPYLDVGKVFGGATVERTAILRNWSDAPVRIVGAPASCSCSIPTELPAVIPSGRSLEIRFRLVVPRSGTGFFTNSVSVWTDSTAIPVVKFDVGGLLVHESQAD